jgi:hypothetical protein
MVSSIILSILFKRVERDAFPFPPPLFRSCLPSPTLNVLVIASQQCLPYEPETSCTLHILIRSPPPWRYHARHNGRWSRIKTALSLQKGLLCDKILYSQPLMYDMWENLASRLGQIDHVHEVYVVMRPSRQVLEMTPQTSSDP